jgi:hypothetical protein
LGKSRCSFKQSDVVRLLKAVRAAGIEARVEVDPASGKLTVTSVREVETSTPNAWDEVLKNATDKKRSS